MRMVFVVAGFLLGPGVTNLLPISADRMGEVADRDHADRRGHLDDLLSVVAHGLSATPLSIWYARRLEAAKEPPVELAGMSELGQRRGVLAGPPGS